MLFVGIARHTPSQCPGHVKEVFDQVSADMPKLPELAQQHGVKPIGQYIMYKFAHDRIRPGCPQLRGGGDIR